MKRNLTIYLASLLLFGSNGIVVSAINLPSHEIALLRTSLGALLLVFLFLRSGSRFVLQRNPRNFALVAGSGCALGIGWIFVYLAYREVGVAVASLLYAMGPVGLIALSPWLFGEHLTKKAVAGFVAVVTGAVLVNGLGSTTISLLGVAYGLAAASCYTVMIALSKKAIVSNGLERTAIQLSSAALTVAAAITLLGMPLALPSTSDIAPALILGFINTGVGCYLYFTATSALPTRTVASCSYLEPLSAVILSALILGEALTLLQWVGAGLIIAGALFCELSDSTSSSHSKHKSALKAA